MTPAVLNSRIQAILDMVKINTSMHTVHLSDRYSEYELFRGSVVPYLETNRFRPHLLAIQKTRPITYRAKVLGRALPSARNGASSFWMLLSGNAEVAFPSRTTTIAAAASLTTPTAAATTSTANVAAIAASVVSDKTTSATGSLLTATAAATSSAVTPSTATASDAFAPTVTATASDAFAPPVATASAGQKRKARP
jgi:hypothetical protein